ncbi:beta-1,3-glucanase family protein [Ruminiclostridium cellobioparum]|uniref:Beta and Gamma crystallin/Carbohydrate binding domain protein n=1 Tax=Ruminiclostridium cellobioparum subsp. termitidis CT1112 TaxID=1195236 RepID=S0FQE1_RUMCE|nr:beta-1,3-glucanase family protein [Ruminiclostridium cellobioparum]EMS72586.1 Beta and Gamma crystallin/Carbohydrate binding domain protein [Ruminiclostridium cellobioparum subsp. termitidis CT1112]
MHTLSKKSLGKILALVMVLALLCGILTTIQASAAARGAWAPNTAYAAGDTVTYSGSTYTCIQAHTSLTGWEPPNVPALWEKGSGGTTPPPETNGVTFYADINYGGTAITLGAGNYTLAQLNTKGIPNDWMSSLKVPDGWTVEVYEHDNFGGTKWTYTSSSSWVGTDANDRMSSVKVISGTPVQTVAAPAFNPAAGGYTSSVSVTLACATSGATIRYTTDGSTPTAASAQYTGAISVTSTKTIKAIAVKSGMTDSAVASATYTINTSNSTSLIPLNSGMQMTIQFNNNTNGVYSNGQIYANIIGKNRNGQFCTISPDGTMTQCVSGQNASPYFYPLSSLNGFQIPAYVSSGRLYISMGTPLDIPFNTAADGTVGIAYPNIENPSDSSYNKYFDWAEFAVINGEVWINTTQVDMFGVPYTIEMFTGSSNNYSSFAKVGITESRASIFSAFQKEVPAEFKSLATVQAPYRIVAPIHGGFRAGQTNGTYFNSYINSIWSQYSTSNFVLTVPQGTFTGRVSGTQMNFTRPGDTTVYRVNKPTGEDVWGGAGTLATGNEIEKVLQAQICAAFHRHVIGNAANLNNPSAYYQTGPADYYAKFFHDHSLNAKAYGFCYDDVNDQSSAIHATSPRGAIINIGW